jgi:hypothetical protein
MKRRTPQTRMRVGQARTTMEEEARNHLMIWVIPRAAWGAMMKKMATVEPVGQVAALPALELLTILVRILTTPLESLAAERSAGELDLWIALEHHFVGAALTTAALLLER